LKLFKQKLNILTILDFLKKYFLIWIFLIILSFSFIPSNNSQAKKWYEYLNAATPVAGEINSVAGISGTSMDPETGKIHHGEPDCSFLDTPGKCLLLPIFGFSKILLEMSGALFVWIIDVDNIKTVLTSPALYRSWTYIRDLLNMAFIMVLLFSAFCTIFQIEAYNYKKMLWKIVLMALLVNFSFPLTRFIIDFSNILMYSIIKSSFFTNSQAQSSLVEIAKNSALEKILSHNTWPDAASLMGAAVMIFMLAITFLAIGILLLIRIVALAILIIFSPIAFVGTILPGASSYASKWWENLFKYSFFGPIMIMGVAISVELMNGVGKDLSAKMIEAASKQSTSEITFLGSMVFILMPIVLLWMVMGVAQSMSIAGASAITTKARGAIKAGLLAPVKVAKWGIKKGAEATGVPGGIKQKWTQFKKTGPLGSDARENREAIIAGSGPFAVPNIIDQTELKRIKEARERLNIDNMPEANLREIADDTARNSYERSAAIQRLSERRAATQADLDYVQNAFHGREVSQAFLQLVNKVKTYNPTAAFSYVTNAAIRQARITEHVNGDDFDYNKLDANALNNPTDHNHGREFLEIAIREGAINAKKVVELRKKGGVYNDALTRHLDRILNSGAYDNAAIESNQNMHMAYFAQTGNIHNDNANFANHITKTMDADTAGRMTRHTVNTFKTQIENNISQGKIKTIAYGMNKADAAKDFVGNLGAAGSRFEDYVNSASDLKNF
jgi:hypothetical protein